MQALYLATLGAAEALRLDPEIGNFVPGKEADFVVLDCSLGTTRVQELCRHLDADLRVPFTKIILTSGSKPVQDCFEGRIFGWIKKPFTFLQLRCCLGQAE